jgi:lysozyme family protein
MPVDNFPGIIKEILKAEGGAKYTDHPSDRGGPTKYGVTQAVLTSLYPGMSVRDLTQELAEKIYFTEYWKRNNIDKILDRDSAHMVMDTVVNHGSGGGGKMVQRALNDLGAGLKVDGGIGPITIKAINTRDPKVFRNTLYLFRKAFYEADVRKNPEQSVFLKGWLARIDRFKGGVVGGGLLFAAAAAAAVFYYLKRGRFT